MGKTENHRQDLLPLFEAVLETGDSPDLVGYLLANSNLPGRRANLELASAFGHVVGNLAERGMDQLWDLCFEMTEISADAAAVDDARSFLPFCGAIGLGTLGALAGALTGPALARLRVLAGDPRWRIREAVSFGLSPLLADRTSATLQTFAEWVDGGDPLELRAVAAGVADPPALESAEIATTALKLHEQILARVAQWPASRRRSDAFRTLRKGLAFTLSVVVVARPDEGLALMRQLAESQDRDIRWILRQNLKKKRLASAYPDDVQALTLALQ